MHTTAYMTFLVFLVCLWAGAAGVRLPYTDCLSCTPSSSEPFCHALLLPYTQVENSPYLHCGLECYAGELNFRVNQYVLFRPLSAREQSMVFDAHTVDTYGVPTSRYVVKAAVGAREPSLVTDAHIAQRCARWREAIALAQVGHHRNIVRLREVIEDPGREAIYLVFDHGGSSLASTHGTLELSLDRGTTPHERFAIASQLVDGLRHIHSRGVIHGDITPNNILLEYFDGRPIVRFTDFGAAKVFDIGKCFGKPLEIVNTASTPMFRAPESVDPMRVAPTVDGEAVDVWALGITLYILVHGKNPWTLYEPAQLLDKIVHEPIALPPDALCGVLPGMLERDPSRRWTLRMVQDRLRDCSDELIVRSFTPRLDGEEVHPFA
mmetsp:Transcript_46222/g.142544  ORF Transcript_46222/g.142544 Transcript_46222/m.142544 type:complete len:379 (-) Transcript_46222:89-1225(-)|eukprot:CAMPEP_0174864902 /NCGR_PEP_ID=MMETSP1114-20130205/59367_1 /TAXON_ID=312471 /ORGANISM="Neobodo designis, Strain CCAP 1951/1" /LENGTH=378 /DNA_ID=CAMNT_0016100017 /DNA_START=51 /DNA_END=1187 /DNA_ORIENTATION=+